MTVNIKLREIVKNDRAVEGLGLNPWCVADGSDGNDIYVIELSDAIAWGLINPNELAKGEA